MRGAGKANTTPCTTSEVGISGRQRERERERERVRERERERERESAGKRLE